MQGSDRWRTTSTCAGPEPSLPYDPAMAVELPELSPEAINAAIREAFPPAAAAQCTDIGEDFAVVTRKVDPESARPGGLVSGPAQFGMADSALWYLTFGVIGRIELMALTSDLDITYLRPAEGEVISARADLLSAGSRKIVGSVRVWCDDRFDKPCSVAKGTYVLPREG